MAAARSPRTGRWAWRLLPTETRGQAAGEAGPPFGSLRGEGPGSHVGTVTFSLRCVLRAPLVHRWRDSARDRPSRPGPEPPALSRSVPKTALWDTPNSQGGHCSYSQKFYLSVFCNCREGGESQGAQGARGEHRELEELEEHEEHEEHGEQEEHEEHGERGEHEEQGELKEHGGAPGARAS